MLVDVGLDALSIFAVPLGSIDSIITRDIIDGIYFYFLHLCG